MAFFDPKPLAHLNPLDFVLFSEKDCRKFAQLAPEHDAVAAAFQMTGWDARGTTFAHGTNFAAVTLGHKRVSFAAVEPCGYLVIVYTLPEFRRHGLATRTIDNIRQIKKIPIRANAVSHAGAALMRAINIDVFEHSLDDFPLGTI